MATTVKRPTIKAEGGGGVFHFKGKAFHAIFICSVLALCFCIYGNGIRNGFSLDDEFVIHGDTAIQKGAKGIPALFKKRYAWDQKGSYGYRPVSEVTYAIEYMFFRDDPHPGHVINIFIYAIICILLFYLLRKLFYNDLGDYFLFIALALFTTHPLHSEVVDSLKNRDEMLVFLFGLYAIWAFLKCFDLSKKSELEQGKLYAIPLQVLLVLSAGVSLTLGSLCKLDALIFVPVTGLAVYFYLSNRTGLWKRAKPVLITVISLFVIFVICRKFLKNNVIPHSDYHRTFTYVENPLVGVHWYHKFPLLFSSFSFYVSKLAFPKNLVSYYGYDAFNAFPTWTDFSVIAGISMIAGGLYILYKNQKNSVLVFMILLFGGTIFPYLNFMQMGPGIVAERFMFIPSVGFVLLATYLLFYVLKLKPVQKISGDKAKFAIGIACVVCLIFSARVIVRNPDWFSHFSVYRHDVEEAPRSAKLQSLLAATYIEKAQRLKAEQPTNREKIDSNYKAGEDAYLKSVEIYPYYGTSWNNLGMIQYTLYNNLNKGIGYFKKALAIDSTYTEALFNLGASYEAKTDKYRDSVNTFVKDSSAADKNRDFFKSPKSARIAARLRRNAIAYGDSSENYYQRTLLTKPNYNMAYIYLSRLYFSEGQYDKSIELNKNALKNGNKSDVVYINLGNGYLVKNDTANAVDCYEKALTYYDKNYYLCQFLAKYYFGRGDLDKARKYKQMYKRAMQYKNNNRPAE